jgi:hypothetical protein
VNGRREKAYLFGPGSAPMKIGEHDWARVNPWRTKRESQYHAMNFRGNHILDNTASTQFTM